MKIKGFFFLFFITMAISYAQDRTDAATNAPQSQENTKQNNQLLAHQQLATPPQTILGMLGFAIVPHFSIFIHEKGHYDMATFAGYDIAEFRIGKYGPILFKKTVNNFNFQINAIPLGGNIRAKKTDISDARFGPLISLAGHWSNLSLATMALQALYGKPQPVSSLNPSNPLLAKQFGSYSLSTSQWIPTS